MFFLPFTFSATLKLEIAIDNIDWSRMEEELTDSLKEQRNVKLK